MSVQIADFIAAPNSGGNWRKLFLVVHVTISPETPGAARGVVATWNRNHDAGLATGSTQFVVDGHEIIQCVRETAYAWSAGTTANKYGIHVEHVGFLQTIRQWRDDYSSAELALSAPLFAELAAKHGIPLRRIGPDQIRRAVASGDPADGGVCGHIDFTHAFPGETSHTDPGAFFPWRHFMQLTQEDDMPTPDEVAAAVWRRAINEIGGETLPAGRMLAQVHNRSGKVTAAVKRVDRGLADLAESEKDNARRAQIQRLRNDLDTVLADAGDDSPH